MSEETKARFEQINQSLPTLGDQIVRAVSMAAGEGVYIVLHVVIPSNGAVMMTTNMEQGDLEGFMRTVAAEFAEENYTVEEGVTIQ